MCTVSDLCFVIILQLLRYLLIKQLLYLSLSEGRQHVIVMSLPSIIISFSSLSTNYYWIVVIVQDREFSGLSWRTVRFVFRPIVT